MGLQKIVVLCLAIAAVGGGVWYFTQDDVSNNSLQDGSSSVEQDNKILSGVGSFRDLIIRGDSIKCDFNQVDDDGVESYGVFYFNNDRFRADNEQTNEGKTFNSSIIYGDSSVYSWTTSEGETFGFVFDIPEGEGIDFSDTNNGNEQDGSVSIDDEIQYDCQSWRVDEGIFNPPEDIEFLDMAAMFENTFEDTSNTVD